MTALFKGKTLPTKGKVPPKTKGKVPPKGSSQPGAGPKDARGGSAKKPTGGAQAIWTKAYQAAKKAGADEAKAKKAADNAVKMAGYVKQGSSWVKKSQFTLEADISKSNDDQMQVFGWAYVSEIDGEAVVDHSGEHVPIEELEKGIYAFNLGTRDQGEMHLSKGKGQLIESMVFTKEKYEALGIDPEGMPLGAWVGFQMTDPDCYAKAKNGDYPMLSIHGSGVRAKVDADDDPGLGILAAAKTELALAESFDDLSPVTKQYVILQSEAERTDRIAKGVGTNRHGPSIKCPDIYEALKREGMTKTRAAKISNECWSSGDCNCH